MSGMVAKTTGRGILARVDMLHLRLSVVLGLGYKRFEAMTVFPAVLVVSLR